MEPSRTAHASTLLANTIVASMTLVRAKRYLHVCYAVWLYEGLLVLAVLNRAGVHLQLHVRHPKHVLLQQQAK
jgi:hypothetical protein